MRRSVVVVMCVALGATGCSPAWVGTLDSLVGTAAPALINILQIVAVANGEAVNGDLVAKIGTDAGAIQRLAGDLAQASTGAGAGVCQQLEAAVGVYEADQSLVLQVAQVSDPNTQTKITLLAGLVAGTVAAITAAIPSCQRAGTTRSYGALGTYRLRHFVTSYNKVLVERTGNAAVDAATPGMKLDGHRAWVRAIPLGRRQ